jgi:hypothetical protein
MFWVDFVPWNQPDPRSVSPFSRNAVHPGEVARSGQRPQRPQRQRRHGRMAHQAHGTSMKNLGSIGWKKLRCQHMSTHTWVLLCFPLETPTITNPSNVFFWRSVSMISGWDIRAIAFCTTNGQERSLGGNRSVGCKRFMLVNAWTKSRSDIASKNDVWQTVRDQAPWPWISWRNPTWPHAFFPIGRRVIEVEKEMSKWPMSPYQGHAMARLRLRNSPQDSRHSITSVGYTNTRTWPQTWMVSPGKSWPRYPSNPSVTKMSGTFWHV